jgi:HAD superfamily hydrolase (TIGR01509 family)
VTEISLILFDLNGVLYRYDRAVRIDALAAVTGVSAGAVKAAVWDSGFEDSGDAGAMDADAYLAGLGACMGTILAEADWVAALHAAISPIDAALALVPRIRPGVVCAVLTNNNMLVERHFSTLYREVAARVGNRAFVSAEFGLRKPDPAVYLACLARLGVEPAAALFIDDSQANVDGAVAAGLEGFRSLSAEDLAAGLGARGLLD